MRSAFPHAARAFAAALLVAIGVAACAPSERQEALDADAMQSRIAAVLRVHDTLDRNEELTSLLRRLGPDNVSGAAAAFEDVIVFVTESDIRPFMHAWASFDGEGALQYALGWRHHGKRRLGANEVIRQMALSGDPAAARERALEIQEPQVRESALAGAIEGMALRGDLKSLDSLISQMLDDTSREGLILVAVGWLLMERGVEGAIQWVDAVPADAPNGYKKAVFQSLLRQVTYKDPQRGAAWYDAHANRSFARAGIGVVGTSWIEGDPAEALEWLAKQQAGNDRDVAIRRAAQRWLSTDPVAADAWFREQEQPDPALMPAIESFARNLSKTNPSEAVVWAQKISDESTRNRTLVGVIAGWRNRDREAADAWLAKTDLPEPVLKSIERVGRRAARAAEKSQR